MRWLRSLLRRQDHGWPLWWHLMLTGVWAAAVILLVLYSNAPIIAVAPEPVTTPNTTIAPGTYR
jgi:hypothetical protein